MILKLFALSNDDPETGMALVLLFEILSLFFHSGIDTEKFNNLLLLSIRPLSLVQEQMHKLIISNKYKEHNKFVYLFLSKILDISDSFSHVSSLRERRDT